ncbi:methyltransferase domain-containing protein [Peptostreptococcus faecalis]|uniref:hypothetical protein n=1 Tax=Peptostreptococcus faecalis TaxID=2045015 RepID=UPI000C7C8C86|nr:hypothetical protein [Peptostreptococcus faecalis]
MNLDNIIMKELINIIDYQLYKNMDMNIFYSKSKFDLFDTYTINRVSVIRNEIKNLNETTKINICNYYLKSFLMRFYSVNQYIYFSKNSKKIIKFIAYKLLDLLSNLSLTLEKIEENHFNSIKMMIKNTNPIIYNINRDKGIYVQKFACSEYSSSFIKEVLNLNYIKINEPVLDIGCGSEGNLVNDFNKKGIEIYGFDINAKNKEISNKDWFDFKYGVNKWGTIISNLSFCSHFLHHHLNNSNLIEIYAITYMKIINSLKLGGAFIYAPSLPFIEDLLPKDKYFTSKHEVYNKVNCTTIIRIK